MPHTKRKQNKMTNVTKGYNNSISSSSSSSWLISTACAGCIMVLCVSSWSQYAMPRAKANAIMEGEGQLHLPPEYVSSHSSSRFLESIPDDIYYSMKNNNNDNNNNVHIKEQPPSPPVPPDITPDETCKEYIFKFLNGTTDFKDECQGMYNAYQAANCANDINENIPLLNTFISLQRKHHHFIFDDDNVTEDDVLIDDFYENWVRTVHKQL